MEGKELEKEGLQLGHELQEAFFWFHRHPELSYEEYQTTEKIREFLAEHGIGIMDSELETGLIAVIHGERERELCGLFAAILMLSRFSKRVVSLMPLK